MRWTLLSLLALALILVPFLLYEESLAAWTEAFLAQERSGWLTAAALGGLLAADLAAPVPSSLVATACGYTLGFGAGAAVCWLGMNLGAAAGYAVGRWGARPLMRRFVGEQQLARATALHERRGEAAIIVSRAVPVLAEASVVAAGAARMPPLRFALAAGLANLGVSLVYAAVGAWALETESFLLAFAGAVLLPGLMMWIAGRRSGSA